MSAPLVYLSIMVVAVCGIIYELIIGAVSSYLWGDSVLYFSITIGLYMSAMGLGAFASKFVRQRLFDAFVASETLIALIGGSSSLFLFWSYGNGDWYEEALVLVTVLIGMLVGLEIPLLIRLLETQSSLRRNVAHVLSYDYIGGLIGALLFPLLLLPQLGLIRTALVLGLTNLLVAGLNFIRHRRLLRLFGLQVLMACITAGWLGYALSQAPSLQNALEQRLYRDQVVLSHQTPYQHLTLTQWHQDLRLYINGGLQFSSLDEYRYHESLVHVPMLAAGRPQRVLILGGGDGLALREVLKHPVSEVTLVDIDAEMIRLFQTEALLKGLNGGSLSDPRLKLVIDDAHRFAARDTGFYDVILVDLPDPGQTALTKLYSQGFYQLLARRLSRHGALVTQSTSPFFAREAFWCIHKTLQAAGLAVRPYQVEVPSFGNWGFQLASLQPIALDRLKLPPALRLRFLNDPALQAMFVMPEDLRLAPDAMTRLEISTLSRPVILDYYERGWDAKR